MKKKFKLDELDCAVCGAKMEDAIRKIPGVNSVQVNYLLQKLILDADDARFNAIVKEAQAVCAKIEPDCKLILT